MRKYRRGIVGGVLLALQLQGCTSWRAAEVAPRQVVEEQRPSAVRVLRADGTRVVLGNPQVQGDTLYGDGPSDGSNGKLAVPLTDVNEVALRRGDGLKTIGLVLGTAAVVAGVLLGTWVSTSSGN